MYIAFWRECPSSVKQWPRYSSLQFTAICVKGRKCLQHYISNALENHQPQRIQISTVTNALHSKLKTVWPPTGFDVDYRRRRNVAIASCATVVITTFRRDLWSIAGQTHGSIKPQLLIYKICRNILAFWLVFTYDLLEGMCLFTFKMW